MCFSAQASFMSSALLTSIGALTVIKTRHHYALAPFAALPLLFAIQQLCEGIIWLTVPEHSNTGAYFIAVRFYLIIAYLVWPSWIPISIIFIETERWRKMACYVALLASISFAWYTVPHMIKTGFWVHIERGHILYPYYGASLNFSIPSFLYLYATITPLLASHMRYTKLLAAAACGSLFLTAQHYPLHITSIWCFFAALLSTLVLLIVCSEANRKKH